MGAQPPSVFRLDYINLKGFYGLKNRLNIEIRGI